LESKIFSAFPRSDQTQLSALCLALLEAQQKSWPELSSAQEGLADIQIRSILGAGYEVGVQFNPARRVSAGAAVDAESIKNRPCFLCAGNLPPEQKGILYQKDYLILCNPAPVFAKHFTIVHMQHQPQAIAASIGCLLDLTADLSPEFAVFYNGPACGASAPDHLHFQAIPANSLPLLQFFPGHFRIISDAAVKIYCGEGINRAAIVLVGGDKDLLLFQFARLVQAAQKILALSDEPMINVLCSSDHGQWRIMIFLRSKHRPDAFFAEGEQRIFISPGAIDMAGLIITPLKLDFDRLDGGSIRQIYSEVSLPADKMEDIIQEL
jgi:hypothetical protein